MEQNLGKFVFVQPKVEHPDAHVEHRLQRMERFLFAAQQRIRYRGLPLRNKQGQYFFLCALSLLQYKRVQFMDPAAAAAHDRECEQKLLRIIFGVEKEG